MSQGPETRFIASIHRLLPESLHWEKMHNQYSRGTADVWYSGTKGDLWIEYKYITKLPKHAAVRANLSGNQVTWLQGRYEEGRKVLVVVGHPDGATILHPLKAFKPVSLKDFKGLTVSKKDCATLIMSHTMGDKIVQNSSETGGRSAGRRSLVQSTRRRISGV